MVKERFRFLYRHFWTLISFIVTRFWLVFKGRKGGERGHGLSHTVWGSHLHPFTAVSQRFSVQQEQTPCVELPEMLIKRKEMPVRPPFFPLSLPRRHLRWLELQPPSWGKNNLSDGDGAQEQKEGALPGRLPWAAKPTPRCPPLRAFYYYLLNVFRCENKLMCLNQRKLGLCPWWPGSKYPSAMWEVQETGSVPGSGGSPGGGNATHCSILAWRIPWTEQPGAQSVGSQRVRQDWGACACTCK